LDGLISTLDIHTVLEIGTNHGGAALTMRRAIHHADAKVMTVDIQDLACSQVKDGSDIVYFVGDANARDAIEAVAAEFQGRRLDLLFVDTKHDFTTTMASYAIYVTLLNPKYVVLDDITLNDEMRSAWSLIAGRPNVSAINAAELIPAIRNHPRDPGFGLIVR
jgi:cephalosporin hydroxylase